MMKAITIWQPWASLLATGAKRYETRGWATKYRGPIAIHAAARNPIKIPHDDDLRKFAEQAGIAPWADLPRGAVIAMAELVNVWHIVYHPGTDVDTARHIPVGAESLTTNKHDPHFNDFFVPTEAEIAFGDWTPGRYAWELANVKLITPVPVKGKQGLLNWDEQSESRQS